MNIELLIDYVIYGSPVCKKDRVQVTDEYGALLIQQKLAIPVFFIQPESVSTSLIFKRVEKT